MNYTKNSFVFYKGDTYLIIDIIMLENFQALLCQKDSSNKIETIEIPVIKDKDA